MAKWCYSEIPGPDTQWQGSNMQRLSDPAHDALVTEMSQTADLATRGALARKMNDMIMQSCSFIPLVQRGGASAHVNILAGVKMTDWDSELWNIAVWSRAR